MLKKDGEMLGKLTEFFVFVFAVENLVTHPGWNHLGRVSEKPSQIEVVIIEGVKITRQTNN